MVDQPGMTELEDPEGIGSPEDPKDPEDESLGDPPLDTTLIRTESRTVFEVIRRIGQDNYIMDPDFQRDFIWDERKQSKLIESVLMRIPLPVFYIAENQDGRVVVVDGLQRLSTFRHFVEGGLRLRLPAQSELNNKKFADLPARLQNRIEDFNLSLYIIDAKAPEQTRLDIFERVNSGVALSRQQMRNCLYVGPATRFLRDEAATDIFRTATGNSLDSRTMRDREFINRFCGFQLLSNSYRGDMDLFLAETLRRMNLMSDLELIELSEQLRTGLTNNHSVFGRQAFRKHSAGQEKRNVINASIWDVMSTGLSRYNEDTVIAHAHQLQEAFFELLSNPTFDDAITYGTNQWRRVRRRFTESEKMLCEVLGA